MSGLPSTRPKGFFLTGILPLSATALAAGGAILVKQGQDPKTTDVPIQGHYYEVAKLEPTPERVAGLKVPDGFRIQKFAELQNPRIFAVAPDGTLYVSQRETGNVVMLRDTNGDGVADVQRAVLEKKHAHGVTVHRGFLYVATVKEVLRAPIQKDGTVGTAQVFVRNLPDAGQHPNRTISFGPDGLLYISVGSTCNACDEPNEENATILRVRADGTGRRIFASGLRNTIGFGWHPTSKRMFGMDHGIDWLGNDEGPEELNEIVMNGRYGWPYVYADSKFNPGDEPPPAYTKEKWAAMSKEPLLMYTAHSAPMQGAFYTGTMFPGEYKNNAFWAMRGSWNRKPPSGYEIVRVRFDEGGRPTAIEPFITGFLVKGGAERGEDAHIGRLCGVAMLKDGSLVVGDDTNGVIYRVTYGRGDEAPNKIDARRKITLELPEGQGPGEIQVRSEVFDPGAAIPERNSAYADNASPALSWSGVPPNAQSVVVLMEDPDAMNPKPFVHWVVANIPPTVTRLPGALPKSEKVKGVEGAVQGSNHTGGLGYFGPKPPAADPAHRYHFQVFALDTTLDLKPGFNRHALLDAMRGHVLARGEVVGTYDRE